MIDYSVSARPNPQDRSEEPKYYASPQVSENVSMINFCKHISEHNSKYNRADIMAVLTQTVDCLYEMLLDGKKIELGELGSFQIGLQSKGALSADHFDPTDHIKKVYVNWTPGVKFASLKSAASWNLVANRRAQRLLLKAITNGSTTVDLSVPDEETGDTGEDETI